MDTPVAYALTDGIARITLDDGKRNVMSAAALTALRAAFERAELDRAPVLLAGREGIFSAGFDLQVFARRDPDEVHAMMRLGAELALRVFTFPLPVVVACTGHAYPLGAFLMLAADGCVAADGPYRIGLNEVPIGLALPRFAVELARARLAPPWFNRITAGELLAPADARAAGYADEVVMPGALAAAAWERIGALAALDRAAFRLTKERIRAPAAAAIRRAIDEDITPAACRALAQG